MDPRGEAILTPEGALMTTATVDYDYHPEEDNNTMYEYAEWRPSYSLIPVLYMIIFILGFTGNGIVMFTVWKSDLKRQAADVYIGHLALADLTFVVTLPLWAVYTALSYHWPFGMALCKISNYVVTVNMYASVFCLTCMSLDRYLTTVWSRGSIVALMPAIWLASIALATPFFYFFSTTMVSSIQTICFMDFSAVTSDQEQEEVWFTRLSLLSTVLFFLLPLLGMSVWCCLTGHHMRCHFNGVHKEAHRHRLAVIRSLVVAFAICWTPVHVLRSAYALSYLRLAPNSYAFLSALLLVHPYTTCLAYINSCLNPFLYAFFDRRFRAQCLQLLRLGDQEGPEGSGSSQTHKCEAQTLATKV